MAPDRTVLQGAQTPKQCPCSLPEPMGPVGIYRPPSEQSALCGTLQPGVVGTQAPALLELRV